MWKSFESFSYKDNTWDMKLDIFKFLSVSLTGKVSCSRAKDLGSNLAYTKNQLVSWHGKSNYYEQMP